MNQDELKPIVEKLEFAFREFISVPPFNFKYGRAMRCVAAMEEAIASLKGAFTQKEKDDDT